MDGTCTECGLNTVLSGTSCVATSCSDAQCIDCPDDINVCDQCAPGYSLDDTNTCAQCSDGCDYCDPVADTCHLCSSGYYFSNGVCVTECAENELVYHETGVDFDIGPVSFTNWSQM